MAGPDQDKTVKIAEDQPQGLAGVRLCPQCGLKVSVTTTICPQDGTDLGEAIELDRTLSERYEFIEAVGSGGMSVIYKVRQPLLDKLFAVKMLHSHILNEQSIKRFEQEARTLGNLKHDNIIAVHDFGISSHGQPYMVMDFAEGLTLAEHLKKSGFLPLPEAIDIFLQVCSALEYAHGQGVLHRDLKPSNIMLTPVDGGYDVRLVDFGIAKVLESGNSVAHQLTRTGELFGSPLYMSPEQCMGKSVDHRSDIYSLGCLLYESLAGDPPHHGETLIETIFKHLNETPKNLKEARPEISFPRAIDEFVMKLVEKNPCDRFQSMTEVRERLLSIQAGALRGGIRAPRFQWPAKLTKSTLSVIAGSLLFLIGILSLITSVRFLEDANRKLYDKQMEAANSPDARAVSEQLAFYGRTLFEHMPHQYLSDEVVTKTLSGIGELATLDLSHAPVTDEAVKSIMKVRGLKRVDLSGTDITSDALRTISKMGSIETLLLNDINAKPQDYLVIADMKNLRELHLQGTSVKDETVSKLSSLPRLETLDLRDTTISDDAMRLLSASKSLRVLLLSGTAVSDRGLAYISQMPLGALQLADTKVTGAGLRQLSKMNSLYQLRLNGLSIGDNDLSALSSLPKLNYLELKRTSIRGDGLKFLIPLAELRHIQLDNTLISDSAASNVLNMAGLKELSLSGTPVTDSFIEQVAARLPLERLSIANTRTGDRAASQLARAQHLKDIDLGYTKITDSGLKKLSGLPHLSEISLWGCSISKQAVAQFRRRKPNCKVNIWMDY